MALSFRPKSWMHKIAAKNSSYGCSKDPEITSWLHPHLQKRSYDACSDQHTQNNGGRSDLCHTWWPVGIICIFMKKFCSSISPSPSLKSPKTLGFSLIMTVGPPFFPAVNTSLGVHLHAPGEGKQRTHTHPVGMGLGSQQEWLRENKRWAGHFQAWKVLWRDGPRPARWTMSLERGYDTAGVVTEDSQGEVTSELRMDTSEVSIMLQSGKAHFKLSTGRQKNHTLGTSLGRNPSSVARWPWTTGKLRIEDQSGQQKPNSGKDFQT